ncbi:hypothetical protein HY374_02090 [Candidatus Berkelbacteria bacterium]|nr:hypothetical protein [Candidatus Berkelbacteria bacterium]
MARRRPQWRGGQGHGQQQQQPKIRIAAPSSGDAIEDVGSGKFNVTFRVLNIPGGQTVTALVTIAGKELDEIREIAATGPVTYTEVELDPKKDIWVEVEDLNRGIKSNRLNLSEQKKDDKAQKKEEKKRLKIRIDEANRAHVTTLDEKGQLQTGTLVLSAPFKFAIEQGTRLFSWEVTIGGGRKTFRIVPSNDGLVTFYHCESGEESSELVLKGRG